MSSKPTVRPLLIALVTAAVGAIGAVSAEAKAKPLLHGGKTYTVTLRSRVTTVDYPFRVYRRETITATLKNTSGPYPATRGFFAYFLDKARNELSNPGQPPGTEFAMPGQTVHLRVRLAPGTYSLGLLVSSNGPRVTCRFNLAPKRALQRR